MIREKIFYTPGLISLLGLSTALLLYLDTKNVFEKLYVLPVNWGYFSVSYPSDYKTQFFESLNAKKFTDIELDSNYVDNAIKLRFAELEIKRIAYKQDSVKGVHFYLRDDMPYEAFVRIIEICTVEKTVAYYGKDNDVWVFNYQVPSQVPGRAMISCGTGFNTPIINTGICWNNIIPPMQVRFLIPLFLFLMLIFFSRRRY